MPRSFSPFCQAAEGEDAQWQLPLCWGHFFEVAIRKASTQFYGKVKKKEISSWTNLNGGLVIVAPTIGGGWSLSSTPRALRTYNCHVLPSNATSTDRPAGGPESPPKKENNCPDELREPLEGAFSVHSDCTLPVTMNPFTSNGFGCFSHLNTLAYFLQ